MRAERFRQVDGLFAAALEAAPEERAALLDAACAGDAELRREVESLLAAHERAGDFIETHALEAAARAQARRLAGAAGRRVGHYQILSPLGAGGMGEVYLALDTRLGRRVALKLLPSEFTRDAVRVRRFELEALAASALNHPNIVTIYDIGRDDDSHFIAAEYVEGRTLQSVIHGEPLKTEEALSVAAQVAEALSAAHAAGIVHRDIKPDNVMLRPDGYVKVLDFGIAKLTEPAPSADGAHNSAAKGQTETGAVVGTVAYMSPDGARLAFNRNGESCWIIEAATPWGEQTPRRIPNPADRRLGGFWAFSWSPDGRRLAGWSGRLNEHPGIVIHTIETGDFERVTEFGSNPVWLRDDRRLLFSHQDKLYVVDSETKKVRELSLPLSPASRLDGYGISSDNRLLYYGLATIEADVWLLDIE